MVIKKSIIAFLAVSPLAVGTIFAFTLNSAVIATNNKSSQMSETQNLISNFSTKYKMEELSKEQMAFFNGEMPLSEEQIEFINENNNGVTFHDLKNEYSKNGKFTVTEDVKKQIIDNYYTKGFFNNTTLEFRSDNKIVKYPKEALDLIDPNDKNSYQKANLKIIELWKAKQFKFPWREQTKWIYDKNEWWPTTFKILPDAPNPNSQEVSNDLVTTTRAWSKEIFGFKTEGSHSYRIPGIITGEDGKIFLNADKRMENIEDYGNDISQVLSVSNDHGKTWSTNSEVIKVQTPKTKRGLVIDGTMVNVRYQDQGKNKTKLVYLVNIFAEGAGIPHLQEGNPWVKIEGVSYLKIWLKAEEGVDSQNYVLKELENKPGWWRMYSLPIGINYDELSSTSQLTSTNVYVDNSYNSETKTVTGTVYENVEESELNNLETLETRKTNHSIWDPYVDTTKYYLAKNNHNIMLESYDEGKTWDNFKLIDWQTKFDPYLTHPFAANGVGKGIQLKYQKGEKSHLNGRIIFPMYNYLDKVLTPYYIYSDDFGKTWKSHYVNDLKPNSSESSMVELPDGSLYWMQRFANRTEKNQPSITKSIDGGLTWINPVDESRDAKFETINKQIVGNVFIGLGNIRLKGEDYFVFGAPKVIPAKAGSLFIMKKGSNTPQEIWSFDMPNKENFAYSYTISVSEKENSAEILIIYEWSSKTKISNKDAYFNERPKGGGIQLDKFTITLK